MILQNVVLNSPHFAPEYIFRGKNYTSPFEIIKEKGTIKLNEKALKIIDHPKFLFCPPKILIDKDIKRVEYKWKFKPLITSEDEFCSLVAGAMIDDAREIESEFSGHTILALVGGKDSMNMLLLPWKNPVIVASAEPNYSLVENFLKDNLLNFKLIKLEDDTHLNLEKEILINCCRLNLEHCRWTGHLNEIVISLDRKVVLLLGQWGDNFFTNKWKRNVYPPPDFHIIDSFSKVQRRLTKIKFYQDYFPRQEFSQQKKFFNNLWYESAHWQGIHMSFLHEYTKCPVLSMYHNENVMNIIQQTEYEKVVTIDLRMHIGERLFGKKVSYPDINPAPPFSEVRKGISRSKVFIDLIQKQNVHVMFTKNSLKKF